MDYTSYSRKMKNANKSFGRKCLGKQPLGKLRIGQEDNTKWILGKQVMKM
jgi:hypothetical protein